MRNKEKAVYFYEQVASNALIDEVAQYVSEACTIRLGTRLVPVGIAGMQQHILDVRNTYPDLIMTILRQFVDGNTVISEFIMEGTHLGEWLGMKPTGKKLSIAGVNIDTFADGKIIEHGGAANTFDALFEAGILKPA